jgi:hypothetical protein
MCGEPDRVHGSAEDSPALKFLGTLGLRSLASASQVRFFFFAQSPSFSVKAIR